MASAVWERITALFIAASALAEPQRTAFVQESAGGDAELVAEVRAMIEADSRATSILDRGLPEAAERLIGPTHSAIHVQEVGAYRLIRFVGEGGMGVVYLAERKDAGNQVADEQGTPRLLDFGIAKELHSLNEETEHTRSGLRLMTPEYAAPERAQEGIVGPYTDVYSLGVILYQMLAGRLPPKSSDEGLSALIPDAKRGNCERMGDLELPTGDCVGEGLTWPSTRLDIEDGNQICRESRGEATRRVTAAKAGRIFLNVFIDFSSRPAYGRGIWQMDSM